MQQDPCWGHTNIRRHHTKFGRHGDLATWRPGCVNLSPYSIE